MIDVALGDFSFPESINNIDNIGLITNVKQNKQKIQNAKNVILNYMLQDDSLIAKSTKDIQGSLIYRR